LKKLGKKPGDRQLLQKLRWLLKILLHSKEYTLARNLPHPKKFSKGSHHHRRNNNNTSINIPRKEKWSYHRESRI
jgi:hypothetical protein